MPTTTRRPARRRGTPKAAEHPYREISFVVDPPKGARRLFWHVGTRKKDWEAECRRGGARALEFLDFCRRHRGGEDKSLAPHLLGFIVGDMVSGGVCKGLEVGFIGAIVDQVAPALYMPVTAGVAARAGISPTAAQPTASTAVATATMKAAGWVRSAPPADAPAPPPFAWHALEVRKLLELVEENLEKTGEGARPAQPPETMIELVKRALAELELALAADQSSATRELRSLILRATGPTLTVASVVGMHHVFTMLARVLPSETPQYQVPE